MGSGKSCSLLEHRTWTCSSALLLTVTSDTGLHLLSLSFLLCQMDLRTSAGYRSERRGEQTVTGGDAQFLVAVSFLILPAYWSGSRQHGGFQTSSYCHVGESYLHTKEATQLHTQQAQTRNQDLIAFETINEKKEEKDNLALLWNQGKLHSI